MPRGAGGIVQPCRASALLLPRPNPFPVLILQGVTFSARPLLTRPPPKQGTSVLLWVTPSLPTSHIKVGFCSHHFPASTPPAATRLNSLRTELWLICLSMPSTVGAQKGAL